MMKNANKRMKLNLYEKSHHKGIFLKEVSRNLKLETEVIQKDVFETTKLSSGTIMARAFKPMPTILDLVFKNFSTYKNLILFMGERGKDTLKDAMKDWDFDYKEKKSITNENSFLLNIKNIKKKKLN